MINSLLAAGIIAASATPMVDTNINNNFQQAYVDGGDFRFKFSLPKEITFNFTDKSAYIRTVILKDFVAKLQKQLEKQEPIGMNMDVELDLYLWIPDSGKELAGIQAGDFITKNPTLLRGETVEVILHLFDGDVFCIVPFPSVIKINLVGSWL